MAMGLLSVLGESCLGGNHDAAAYQTRTGAVWRNAPPTDKDYESGPDSSASGPRSASKPDRKSDVRLVIGPQ